MMTDRELDLLRTEQVKWMKSRVTIRGLSYMAEDEPADATIAKDVPARIKAGFGFFREIADRIQGITAYTITLPWDQSIAVGNKIIDQDTEQVFEVRDVRDKNTYQTATQVLGDRIG